jgi:acetyl-CoA carboxylase carboxyltransferase component
MTIEDAPPQPLQEMLASGLARVGALVDEDSFTESGAMARHRTTAFGMQRNRPLGDGVVTGYARIDGRQVGLFAQEPSVLGGSLGEVHASKIVMVLDYAERSRAPVIGLIDSGGARIQEGIGALDGYAGIFRGNVRLSGRVPQISVILGPCAGGAVYSPALTDIVIMKRHRSYMFLTGPKVVRAVTREGVTADELGGADVHSRDSGVAHLVAEDTAHALELTVRVLSYLPSSCWSLPPVAPVAPPEPLPALPADHRHAYDVRRVVRGLVDGGSFLELQPRFACNLVIGFARVEGRPVGVVANQPQALAGVLDIRAAEKGARFVRMCDAFGLPLVTLVDTPGFLPGTRQEADGVIRKGAKLLYAYAEAVVPRVTVVLRKAFGGAYIVMNSRALGADAVFCWPGAQMAVMGADGAVDLIHRRELAVDPGAREDLLRDYQLTAMAAENAAERLSVDEIIPPSRTRTALTTTLQRLEGALRPGFRHDNLPQ